MPTTIKYDRGAGVIRYAVYKIENISTGAARLRGHVETDGGPVIARNLAVNGGLVRDFEAFRLERRDGDEESPEHVEHR